MKHLLLVSALVLASVGASAQQFDRDQDRRGDNRGGYDQRDRRNDGRGQKNCACVETERRLRGLNLALHRLNLREYDRREIMRDARQGERIHDQVNYNTPYNEQGRLCSLANQAVDRSWRRVQPALARLGLDYAPYCQDRGFRR